MSQYTCIKKCFFQNRLWEPGETLAPEAGSTPPLHFKESSKVKAKPVVEEESPKTFFEMQQQEAKEVVAQKRPESAPAADDDIFS